MTRFMLYLPFLSDTEQAVDKNSNLGYSIHFKLDVKNIIVGIFQINFRDCIDELADILGVVRPDIGWTEVLFNLNYIKNGGTTDIKIFEFVGQILTMFSCDLMLAEQNLNTLLMFRVDGHVKIFEVYRWEKEHLDALGVPVEYSPFPEISVE